MKCITCYCWKEIEMNRSLLQKLAEQFYRAIIKARPEFAKRDRMANFPGGCCDDASDLFGYYLLQKFDIASKQCNGRYEDGNPENTTNHVWLLVKGTIVDLTYGQFHLGATIYVGNENSFYRSLNDKVVQENYNIENSKRLWTDYQKILKYIE